MKKNILTTLVLLSSIYAFTHAANPAPSDTDNDESTYIEKTNSVNPFTECSQSAIEIRDTHLAASRSMYNTAMTQALTERKNREKLAIAEEKAAPKKSAIKTSVETYKNQAKAAQNNLVQARKESWATFEKAIKECQKLHAATDDTSLSEEKEVLTAYAKTPEDRKSIKDTIIESLKSLFD